jgi:putative intracellular protease/amidase
MRPEPSAARWSSSAVAGLAWRDVMKIAYVLYPEFTALDLVGPYEVISRWPDAQVHFVARSLDPVRCDRGLTVIPTDIPETLPDPELIVVPGSENPIPVLSDQVLLDWLRAAAPNCRWTASVCTGAGLYAAFGLLESKKTTTHCRDVPPPYEPRARARSCGLASGVGVRGVQKAPDALLRAEPVLRFVVPEPSCFATFGDHHAADGIEVALVGAPVVA